MIEKHIVIFGGDLGGRNPTTTTTTTSSSSSSRCFNPNFPLYILDLGRLMWFHVTIKKHPYLLGKLIHINIYYMDMYMGINK
jgi:hypothetical protein